MARSKPSTWRDGGLGRVAVAVADRLEQLAVLADGVTQLLDAIEREEPDPQAQQVVLAERGGEERVVRGPVDVPVDALVEIDQAPLIAVGPVELGQQRLRLRPVGGGAALGGGARGRRLEQPAHLAGVRPGRRR